MVASKLIRPHSEYKDSYLEALHEYHAESRYEYQQHAKLNTDFDSFVEDLKSEDERAHEPLADWMEPVPETVLWLVKEKNYIGTLRIRHRLNWHLEKDGGHVGYVIRPSMRGKGYGKKILQKGMPLINYLGIDQALITVDPSNPASIRIVEYCGGVFEDETVATEKFPARRRYWLDCT